MLSLGKLLELTLAGREPAQQTQMTVAGTRLRWLAEGALEVTPSVARDCGLDLLLSAGLHGNETVPVALLDELIHAIARGELQPRARVLFLFGSPGALRRGGRYLEQDLNRLFCGGHELSSGPDAIRAGELERLAETFFTQPERARLHYDLHTSVRASAIGPFAICPWFDGQRPPRAQLARLATLGMRGVLHHRAGVPTFSGYSRQHLGVDAFNLELGNLPASHGFYETLEQRLRALIQGEGAQPDESLADELQPFRVAREIVKHTDAFQWRLGEGIEHFSELPRGTLLAVDEGTRWMVEEQGERLVLPSARVRNGMRAGLVVVPL